MTATEPETTPAPVGHRRDTAQSPVLSSRRSRKPTVADGCASVLVVLGFAMGSRPIGDNSFLTHLATGRLMAEIGSVPTTDPYSAEFAGRSWTVQSWLASALYHGLERTLGLWALPVFHGLLAAGLAWGLWLLVGPARQLVTRLCLVAVPLALGGSYLSPRPLMIGLVCLVVVLLAVDGRLPLWVLVPTMWIWVNAHGSFPLAAVVIGTVVLGSLLERSVLRPNPWPLAGWFTVAMVVSAANPLGPRLWWFPLALLSTRDRLEGVVEWQAATFDTVGQWLYLALVVPLVLAARRRASWARLLPAIVFFVFGFLAVRNLIPAAVVVVAMVAPSLRGAFGATAGESRSLPAAGLALISAVGITAGMVVVVSRPALVLDRYPVAAVDVLERQRLVGPERDSAWTGSLVHRDGVGNYLIHRYGTSASVFIDDRFDFYPLTRTRAHLELLDGGDYDAVLDDVEGDVVLWEAERALARWLADSSRWEITYRDDDWIIACRRNETVMEYCRR